MSPRRPDNHDETPEEREFTNMIGEQFTPEERKAIMQRLFRDALGEDHGENPA